MKDRYDIVEVVPDHLDKEEILPWVINNFYNIEDVEDRHVLLEHGWTLSESPIHSNLNYEVMSLITDSNEYHHMMNEEEKKTLNELPKVVKVYRGILVPEDKEPIIESNCDNDYISIGISWTINKDKGLWFGKRGTDLGIYKNHTPYLLESTIKKRYIYCYLNGRKEDEVIVDPSWFNSKIKVTPLKV